MKKRTWLIGTAIALCFQTYAYGMMEEESFLPEVKNSTKSPSQFHSKNKPDEKSSFENEYDPNNNSTLLPPEEEFLESNKNAQSQSPGVRFWEPPLSILDKGFLALQGQILSIIEGKEDRLIPLLREAKQHPFFEAFKLKYPAELTSPQHEMEFVTKSKVDSTHLFLRPLQDLISSLNTHKDHPQHGSLVQRLVLGYERFASDLCHKSPEERVNALYQVRLRTDFSPNLLMSKDLANRILSSDTWDVVRMENTEGTSPAIRIGDVFFKRYVLLQNDKAFRLSTLDPGFEWGMFALTQLLTEQGLIPSSLLILNHVPRDVPQKDTSAGLLYEQIQKMKPQDSRRETLLKELLEKPQGQFEKKFFSYAVQATPAVQGTLLLDYVKNKLTQKQLLNFDEESFSAHVVNALLMKPVDYKGDNLMVTHETKLIGFDNDLAQCFMLGEDQGKHYAEFRDFVFCLTEPMQKSIHPKIREKMLSHIPEAFVLSWLGHLKSQNYRYMKLLVDQDIAPTLYHQVHLPIKLHEQTVPDLLKDFKELQSLLRSSSIIRHQELFEKLFPLVAAYYEAHTTPEVPWIGFDRLYRRQQSVEDALSLSHVLKSGKTVEEELKFYTKPLREFRKRTQPLEEVVSNFMSSLSWDKMPEDHLTKILEEGIKYFPHSIKDILHSSYLHRVLPHKPSLELLTFLLQHTEEWPQNEAGQTALHVCVRFDTDRVPLLLQFMPKDKIEHKDRKGLTALDWAIESKNHNLVDLLIQNGAGFNLDIEKAFSYYSSHKRQVLDDLFDRNMGFAWKVALEEILPQEGTGLKIKGATSGERIIPQHLISQLIDGKGEISNKASYGRHKVGYLKSGKHTLFFKQYPELPGVEEKVGRLGRALFWPLTPYGELFRINDKDVLVSWGVPGMGLHEILKTSPQSLAKLDQDQLAALTLLAFLTNPEDGKPDNFQVWKNLLYALDNDHSFVQPIAKEQKEGWFSKDPIVQVKTILYVMDHMKNPVPRKIRDLFLSHNIGELLEEWVYNLKDLASSYKSLFSEKERIGLLNNYDSYIGVPFQEGEIERLYDKAVRLQGIFLQTSEIPFFEILKDLEPQLAQRYNPEITQENLTAFKTKLFQIKHKKEIMADLPKEDTQNALIESSLKACEILESKLKITPKLRLLDALTAQDTPDHLYIKFLFIDGDFYLKNTQGGHDTLTTSQHLLKSQSIPLKESLLDKMKQDTIQDLTYRPDMALTALKKIKAQQEQIGGVPLSEIKLDSQFMKKLKETDFNKINLEQQHAIIKAIKGRSLSEVYFVNAKALTDSLLINHLTFSYVKDLDLRGCTKVQDQFFINLEKEALVLEYLNLAHSGIKVVGNSGFINVTSITLPALKGINVNNCDTLRGIHLKAPQLKWIEAAGCPNLKELALQSTPERINLEEDSQVPEEDILKILEDNRQLQTIILKGTKGEEGHTKALELLKGQENKQEIDLSSKNLSNHDLKWVSFLLKNKLIIQLDLGKNRIGDDGVKALGKVIETNLTLTQLDLKNNRIGDEGVKALGKVLETNQSITQLNLEYNSIGDDGVKALGKVLETNPTLTQLNLGRNRIGDEGTKALCKALENNTTLTQLNLEKNIIGNEGKKALEELMKLKPNLKIYF